MTAQPPSSKQSPNFDDIMDAHWKGCAPGQQAQEPIYPNQVNSGAPNDPAVGRTNKLEKP